MAKQTAAAEKIAVLGIDKVIDGLISTHFAKDGREVIAKEAYKASKEKYAASLAKDRELLVSEVEIFQEELSEAERKAVPSKSEVMRAKLEVKKAQQNLDEAFEQALVDATREIVDRCIAGTVSPGSHKVLRRIRIKDTTLPAMQTEVQALKAATERLATMSETSEVKALKAKIEACQIQIADIDAYLADEVVA